MFLNFDIFCRLQSLEGAFGLPEGTFTKRGSPEVCLAGARRWLADNGRKAPLSLSADWISPGDEGLYRAGLKSIQSGLGRHTVESAQDIMQNALMGLGVEGEEGQKPYYVAGQTEAKSILNGKTVSGFAQAAIGRFLHNKGQNVAAKTQRHHKIERETYFVSDFDPLDGKLDLLYQRIVTPANHDRLMDLFPADERNRIRRKWLSVGLKTGRFPLASELAAEFGIASSTVMQRHIQPALRTICDEIQTWTWLDQ